MDADNLPKLNPVTLPESAPKRIPLAKLIEYRNKGLSYQEIGQIVGCSKQNISERLLYYTASINNLKSVKEQRADTLAVVSDTILNSLTPADIKKAPFGTKVTAYGILYDKERLERGQMPENTNITQININIQERAVKIQELQAKLGLDTQESGRADRSDTLDMLPDTQDAGE